MNKKEISNLKKNFKDESENVVFSNFITAYISNDEIKYKDNRIFDILPEGERLIYLDNFKKSLGGKIGKNLIEYHYNDDIYNQSEMPLLYRLYDTELKDQELVDEYIELIINEIGYHFPYLITIALGKYSIGDRDTNNELTGESELEYKFLLFNFETVELTNIGLIFDNDEDSIVKKFNKEMAVGKAPIDGFLFPTLSDDQANINSVMYYTKTPKEPNVNIIENILGCEFTLSGVDESERFASLLNRVAGEDITYENVSEINTRISQVLSDNVFSAETPVIQKEDLKEILSDSGISDEDMSDFDDIYEKEIGEDIELKAINLVNPKVKVKTPEIVVDVKNSQTDKIIIKEIDNKKCLVIDINDDETIKVNNFDVNL